MVQHHNLRLLTVRNDDPGSRPAHGEVQIPRPLCRSLLLRQLLFESASGHSHDHQIQRPLPLTVIDDGADFPFNGLLGLATADIR